MSSTILIIRFDLTAVELEKQPQETLIPLNAVIARTIVKKTSIRFIVSEALFTLYPIINNIPVISSIHGIVIAIMLINPGGDIL